MYLEGQIIWPEADLRRINGVQWSALCLVISKRACFIRRHLNDKFNNVRYGMFASSASALFSLCLLRILLLGLCLFHMTFLFGCPWVSSSQSLSQCCGISHSNCQIGAMTRERASCSQIGWGSHTDPQSVGTGLG